MFVGLIDLSDNKSRFLELNLEEETHFIRDKSMGFRSNGDNEDLILVSSIDYKDYKTYKIYSYSFTNKPTTDTTPWKYDQIYDIEIPESLKVNDELEIDYYVYQTKLFILISSKFHEYHFVMMITQ